MRGLMTAVLAAVLLVQSGCAFSIGGGSTEEVQNKTWGQQLLDWTSRRRTMTLR